MLYLEFNRHISLIASLLHLITHRDFMTWYTQHLFISIRLKIYFRGNSFFSILRKIPFYFSLFSNIFRYEHDCNSVSQCWKRARETETIKVYETNKDLEQTMKKKFKPIYFIFFFLVFTFFDLLFIYVELMNEKANNGNATFQPLKIPCLSLQHWVECWNRNTERLFAF